GHDAGFCACCSRLRSIDSSVIRRAWPVPTLSYSPRFRRAKKVVLPMPSISQASFGFYALRKVTDRCLRGVIRWISLLCHGDVPRLSAVYIEACSKNRFYRMGLTFLQGLRVIDTCSKK